MTNVKPASASEFIEFMREGTETFRPDWDTCGLVLSQAHYLAGFLARHAGAFPGAPMLSQDATGHGVPIPGNAERALSPARRTVTRRARQSKRSEARDV